MIWWRIRRFQIRERPAGRLIIWRGQQPSIAGILPESVSQITLSRKNVLSLQGYAPQFSTGLGLYG
jgi:hypothetical protein